MKLIILRQSLKSRLSQKAEPLKPGKIKFVSEALNILTPYTVRLILITCATDIHHANLNFFSPILVPVNVENPSRNEKNTVSYRFFRNC